MINFYSNLPERLNWEFVVDNSCGMDGLLHAYGDICEEIKAQKKLKVRDIFKICTDLYQGTRVKGADVLKERDRLLLQWGEQRPPLNGSFIDYTDEEVVDEIEYDREDKPYLDISRQVFNHPDDREFDSKAVEFSVCLYFDYPPRGDKSSNMWIDHPSHIEQCLAEYYEVEFVKELIDEIPYKVITSVTYCG